MFAPRSPWRRVKMAAIEIFTSGADYKYKSKLCSLSFLIVVFVTVLSLLTPFFVIRNAGGFSLLHRVYSERPEVSFNYKYLLLANKKDNYNPVICSSFASYKSNPIQDDCILIKVREQDTNNNGRKDKLRFEAWFHTDHPLTDFKLLLFFRFRLKQLFEATIESVAVLIEKLTEEANSVEFHADLTLRQNGPLTTETLFDCSEEKLDLGDESLEQLLRRNSNRKFAAKLSDETVKWTSGDWNETAVKIKGELIYAKRSTIHLQPSVWEELKWAWVQYLSFACVFAYLARRVLAFLFYNRYLSCVVLAPWRNKRF